MDIQTKVVVLPPVEVAASSNNQPTVVESKAGMIVGIVVALISVFGLTFKFRKNIFNLMNKKNKPSIHAET